MSNPAANSRLKVAPPPPLIPFNRGWQVVESSRGGDRTCRDTSEKAACLAIGASPADPDDETWIQRGREHRPDMRTSGRRPARKAGDAGPATANRRPAYTRKKGAKWQAE
jgi:hypothetical protein